MTVLPVDSAAAGAGYVSRPPGPRYVSRDGTAPAHPPGVVRFEAARSRSEDGGSPRALISAAGAGVHFLDGGW